MNCPVCGERLREIQRSGIEVDICPGCKGIWLDRGELDKIVALENGDAPDVRTETARDRAGEQPYRAQEPSRREARDGDYRDDREYDDRRDGRSHGQRDPRRRRSWLGELLEGFGGDD